ncbi:MAG: CP12 domain-containing protein, partial [Cyanobacteriota bacterium]|nr:CP12 domain-containing protein [Cyanobacteriota bacterium]
MKSIDEHIKKDLTDLEAAKAEGNDAKIRHISEELESLQDYKKEHPG